MKTHPKEWLNNLLWWAWQPPRGKRRPGFCPLCLALSWPLPALTSADWQPREDRHFPTPENTAEPCGPAQLFRWGHLWFLTLHFKGNHPLSLGLHLSTAFEGKKKSLKWSPQHSLRPNRKTNPQKNKLDMSYSTLVSVWTWNLLQLCLHICIIKLQNWPWNLLLHYFPVLLLGSSFHYVSHTVAPSRLWYTYGKRSAKTLWWEMQLQRRSPRRLQQVIRKGAMDVYWKRSFHWPPEPHKCKYLQKALKQTEEPQPEKCASWTVCLFFTKCVGCVYRWLGGDECGGNPWRPGTAHFIMWIMAWNP